MTGENNLQTLLANMSPKLSEEVFVFLTSSNGLSGQMQQKALMTFRESEGMTLIIRESDATDLPSDVSRWALITLTIHSDLNAIGFLAEITDKLAAAGIPVNPVSAYYHDHLFVPWEKRNEAMSILQSFNR